MIGDAHFLDPYRPLPPGFHRGLFLYCPTILSRHYLPHRLRFRAPSYRKLDLHLEVPGLPGSLNSTEQPLSRVSERAWPTKPASPQLLPVNQSSVALPTADQLAPRDPLSSWLTEPASPQVLPVNQSPKPLPPSATSSPAWRSAGRNSQGSINIPSLDLPRAALPALPPLPYIVAEV
jgi:hypothetical protein